MEVHSTPEFDAWLAELDAKGQSQVEDRLDRIQQHSHFGDKKYLDYSLFELRWRNGRRAYFGIFEGFVLMLFGGGKNGQDRDVAYARKILERETS